jgi:hypothetical protein
LGVGFMKMVKKTEKKKEKPKSKSSHEFSYIIDIWLKNVVVNHNPDAVKPIRAYIKKLLSGTDGKKSEKVMFNLIYALNKNNLLIPINGSLMFTSKRSALRLQFGPRWS